MTEAPLPGLARRQALRACLERIVTEAAGMERTLPKLNQVDPGLENRIKLLVTIVARTVGAHLEEPGEGLADDLEGLRSATRRLRVPTEEPGLGETFALRELGGAAGRMLNAVLDAQDEARNQGFRPTASSVEKDLATDIPRAGNEDILHDIAARLDEVVERLDQLEHARAEGSDFRAEGRLLDFYIGKMRVQVDLARLQLTIGVRTVDFSALWRATQGMSELTQGFVVTVKAWVGRASTAVTQLATGMGQRVRGVAEGMRVAIRTILRRRQVQADTEPPVQPRSQRMDEPPDDFDIEAVKILILRGKAVPAAWRPFITALNLAGTQVSDVTPLGALTALQSLHLGDTQVSDVTPLGALTALQSLNLRSTKVSDVTPLGALTALRSLDLDGTKVSDVTPLDALKALTRLDLTGITPTGVDGLRRPGLEIFEGDGTRPRRPGRP